MVLVASGITHILLMKYLQNMLPDNDLKMELASGRDFLQVGAVAPDLPYASIADNDFFFSNQSELADKFHYEKTNLVALNGLKEIMQTPALTIKEKRYLFCFFIGFISHIIADGIIHPFIRDKVGNYKENQTAHRVLEMQLDVLFYYHITLKSNDPIQLNYSNIHDELKNFDDDVYPEVDKVLSIFRMMIYEVYNLYYTKEKILGWVTGLHRMFGVTEGKHPSIYRGLPFIGNFLFSNYEDLLGKYDNILTLTKPKDRPTNFLNKPKIHFFDDCVQKFYNTFIPVANKAYNYINSNGELLSEFDIPQIDLDTGRLLANNNLNMVPAFWS